MVFCSFLTFSSYYTVKAWVCLFGTRSGSCLVDEEVMEEEGRKSRPCPWRIDVMVGLLKEAWAVPWGQLVLEWRLGCPHRSVCRTHGWRTVGPSPILVQDQGRKALWVRALWFQLAEPRTSHTAVSKPQEQGGAPLCRGARQHWRGGLYFDRLVYILKNLVCNKMSVAMRMDPSGNWNFSFDELSVKDPKCF